ncbi:MAG: hypothetical protein WA581_15550 [Candidatus Acidiferrales bacterium]
MLNVFLTIDTEVYPLTPNWREMRLRADVDRDIYGVTQDGEFGLRYQLDVLRKHNLKAVFFVEPLFASAPEVGMDPLREIVRLIVHGGHDVQLHPHPEWLPHIPDMKMKGGVINSYSPDVQKAIIERGLTNLRYALAEVGAQDRVSACAFRAGDFAADSVTLRAVADCGLKYDSSYSVDHGRLGNGKLLVQPEMIGDVCEAPVSFFEDWPGHFRPAQLAAASYAELVRALNRADEAGWSAFVIVSHSFELLKNRRASDRPLGLRRFVRSRFEKLCAFLDRNRRRFQTATFSQLASPQEIISRASRPISGNVLATAMRFGEQLADRLTG